MPSEIDRGSALVARAAFSFVLLTLAALLLVPALVQERVTRLRAEIEASEPARTMVLQLQYYLVREMASLSEMLLSGDPDYRRRFREARAMEARLLAELKPLAADLGPSAMQTLAETERRTRDWHRRVVDTAVVAGRRSPWESDVQREPTLFEAALRSAMQVDSTILRVTNEKRKAIARVERIGLQVTFALGALALLAAIAVARLYGGVRRAAAESERQRREAERALEQSARATEARTRLIRGVTHDVKNPLGAAKGFAELLVMGLQGPVPDGQRDYLRRIQRLLDNAVAIITDLLDVARADSGGLTIRARRTDLRTLAEDAMESHRAAAEAAGHELTCEIAQDGIALETDPIRVQQVLGNLLTNAIKYTPAPGRIAMRGAVAEGRRGSDDGPWATIAVSDTGPGIPADMRELIFDEFTRVREDGAIAGHGLGLAIARRIARLLGGDLTAGDAEGGGARFTLWLPLRAAPVPIATATDR